MEKLHTKTEKKKKTEEVRLLMPETRTSEEAVPGFWQCADFSCRCGVFFVWVLDDACHVFSLATCLVVIYALHGGSP